AAVGRRALRVCGQVQQQREADHHRGSQRFPPRRRPDAPLILQGHVPRCQPGGQRTTWLHPGRETATLTPPRERRWSGGRLPALEPGAGHDGGGQPDGNGGYDLERHGGEPGGRDGAVLRQGHADRLLPPVHGACPAHQGGEGFRQRGRPRRFPGVRPLPPHAHAAA
ncbi:unnamed protein product, partial [Ectocarpus fasciculatus]